MQDDWEEDYLSVPEATESHEASENEPSSDLDDLEASYGDYGSARSKTNRDGIEQTGTGEVKSRKDIAKEKQAAIRKQLMEKRIPTALKPIISLKSLSFLTKSLISAALLRDHFNFLINTKKVEIERG